MTFLQTSHGTPALPVSSLVMWIFVWDVLACSPPLLPPTATTEVTMADPPAMARAYAGGEIYPIPTPRLDGLSLRGFNARLSSLVISLSSPSCDDTLSSTASLIVGRSRRHLKGDTPPVKMGIKVQVEWISHKGRMTSGAGTPILPNNSEWVTPP